ncbi:hypothetical protein [Yoonia sp. MH D7]
MLKLIFIGTIFTLGACSSSGSENNLPRTDAASDLATDLAQENLSNPATLPQQGTAQYAGYMTLALPIDGAATDHIGDLDLTVDFGAKRDQISGSASNFTGLSGRLDITGGTVVPTTDTDVDYTFDGTVTGDLGQGGDTYTIDGTLLGDFRGRYQDGITGIIYGDITGPAGQDLFQGSLASVARN